jgi:hypothetical protein
MDYCAKYISELRSSTSLMRKFAARYLRDYGDERAFGPLSHLLSDKEEEVRMTAAETLGIIGDPSVIEALEKAAKDPDAKVVEAAAEAMEKIRSRFPPPGKEDGKEDAAGLPARQDLLKRALAGVGAEIEARSYGFKVKVPLLRGRTQEVRVVYDKSDPEDDPVLLLFTICGDAKEKHFRWALKLNARLTYGSLALWSSKDREQFILITTMLEEDTTADELRKSILTLAEKGDTIEGQLHERDKY